MKDSNQQRLFLAIAIWLACLFGYMALFAPKKGQQQPPPAAAPASGAAQDQKQAAAETPGGPAAAAPPAKAVPEALTAPRPLRKVTFETPRLRIIATSQGAAVESAVLLGDKFTLHKGTKEESQVDLVGPRAGEPLPLSTTVKGADGSVLVPADAAYDLVASSPSDATFRTEARGVTVVKKLSINSNTYGIALAVEVRSARALNGQLAVLFGARAEEPSGGMFAARSTPARAICAAGNKVERLAVGNKTPTWEAPSGVAFAGIDEQYFLTAVMPPQGANASCHLEAHGEKAGSIVAWVAVPVQVAGGGSAQLPFVGYAGPKSTDELNAVGKPLGQAIDWGFWSVIAEVLLGVMKFFYKIVPFHNWGVAIVLLTLAMKVLTFPLQHKSMKSMQEMQRIQPQLEELKKKHAGDTQRQNLEQMKLFKEHGVNPMGSCLPMVIQMPIWFALYTTLQVSVELYNAPFIHGWIDDLTAKDPYYILPVAMGITMVLTQVLTPAPMSNPSQKTMGYVMSGFFSLLMLTLPSGLTLYIFTNNLLSIAQQMYLRRAMKPPPPPAGGQTVEVQKKKEGRAGGDGSERVKVHA
jgi:YidC/Oxa1 family membrane protein insertase